MAGITANKYTQIYGFFGSPLHIYFYIYLMYKVMCMTVRGE